MLLAGVFPLQQPEDAAWGSAGAWLYPIGARHELGTADAAVCPAFKLNRGLEQSGNRLTHEGADLANGRAGDTVRAAASGIVVLAGERDDGYGRRIVIAHRLPEGGLAYTVYAHLREGSTGVKPGDRVCAGDPVARVGQTGRASTPHLHFEVRSVRDPAERWELAHPVDPVAFVDARLPAALEGGPGVAPYLEWAQCEGLIGAHEPAEGVLTRGAWWRMLDAAAARPARPAPTHDSGHDSGHDSAHESVHDTALRDSLITDGVLPQDADDEEALAALSWKDCARDLERLANFGVRMPHGPLTDAAHRSLCRQRFDHDRPAGQLGALRKRHGVPRTADVCVLLADLSGPRPDRELPSPHHGKRGKVRRPYGHHGARHRKHTPKPPPTPSPDTTGHSGA